MSNSYVLGGYLAVAAILGVYVWHLRRRARILAGSLPGRAASGSSRASGPSPLSGSARPSGPSPVSGSYRASGPSSLSGFPGRSRPSAPVDPSTAPVTPDPKGADGDGRTRS